MINLKQLKNPHDIQTLQTAYLQTLLIPLDSYWKEAVIGQAPHWLIEIDGEVAGFFVASVTNRLLQFYVTEPFLAAASELFATVIKENNLDSATAGTFESAYLSHCLDHQTQVAIRSYLFQDHKRVEPVLTGYPGADFRPAAAVDAEDLANFYGHNDEYEDTEAIVQGFGNRLNYARTLIGQGQVFILESEGEIIGVGECRLSETQAPYADLGMITAKNHRRRGIGSYILGQLKKHCYQNEAKPICSCAAENVPSRKTIEKAGFISPHRLLDIEFSAGPGH